MQNRIYFDNNATTPLLPKISEELLKIMAEGFGNASSIHWAGRKPKQILRETRQKLAQYLGVHPTELIFTSGASESNSTILRALIDLSLDHPDFRDRKTIISSNIEHPSVQATLKYFHSLRKINWVTFDVARSGLIDFEKFNSLLSSDVLLVTIMGANNETGLLFPINEMAAMAKKRDILFHSDMTQLFGKLPIDLRNLDYISLSAHKAYALKGCGVLWVRKGAPYLALVHGGSQERYRRSGTENILAIASLGLSLNEIQDEKYLIKKKLSMLQKHFEQEACLKIPDVCITHRDSPRLPNTSHLIIKGVDGESLLMSLDLQGYAVSTGAACSSGSPEPSPILISLGFTPDEAQMSLRVSFGLQNSIEQIDKFISDLSITVKHLRAQRGVSCEF